ncbi:hypothetical protein BEWA_025690 [Theileria equi strain WA]|uniref:RING-type domain-containing protein n=1 Tax=Theileria equi strain WA TaxID=1537102 RepID=L0AVZ1_THEEQ|nr:hypothetical protein BEWA_025690 [Theileria equi strain WA]AFZ79720.1 hypothetical protein BEWA_025690 [Theileria equi strain WA]|eukprot:XP_004829386.1 hypothetical protein BEWA_025690 [Theileria equi strain WA]
MTHLRHFVFLDKTLRTIEDKDGAKVEIKSLVDIAGSNLFLFLLESSGLVHICYKSFKRDDILKEVQFRAFEHEAVNIFFCPLGNAIVVTGDKYGILDLVATYYHNYDNSGTIRTPLILGIRDYLRGPYEWYENTGDGITWRPINGTGYKNRIRVKLNPDTFSFPNYVLFEHTSTQGSELTIGGFNIGESSNEKYNNRWFKRIDGGNRWEEAADFNFKNKTLEEVNKYVKKNFQTITGNLSVQECSAPGIVQLDVNKIPSPGKNETVYFYNGTPIHVEKIDGNGSTNRISVTGFFVYFWQGEPNRPILLGITKVSDTPEYYSYWGNTGGGLGNWSSRLTSGKLLEYLLDDQNCRRNYAIPVNLNKPEDPYQFLSSGNKSTCIKETRKISGPTIISPSSPPNSEYTVKEYTVGGGGGTQISRATYDKQGTTGITLPRSYAISKIRVYLHSSIPLMLQFMPKNAEEKSKWFYSTRENGLTWASASKTKSEKFYAGGQPTEALTTELDDVRCLRNSAVTLNLSLDNSKTLSDKHTSGENKYCCEKHSEVERKVTVTNGPNSLDGLSLTCYKHEIDIGTELIGIKYYNGQSSGRKSIKLTGNEFPIPGSLSVYTFYCGGKPVLIYMNHTSNGTAKGWYKKDGDDQPWVRLSNELPNEIPDNFKECGQKTQLLEQLGKLGCQNLGHCTQNSSGATMVSVAYGTGRGPDRGTRSTNRLDGESGRLSSFGAIFQEDENVSSSSEPVKPDPVEQTTDHSETSKIQKVDDADASAGTLQRDCSDANVVNAGEPQGKSPQYEPGADGLEVATEESNQDNANLRGGSAEYPGAKARGPVPAPPKAGEEYGGIVQAPQLIQSTPMFPNKDFHNDRVVSVSVSECASLVAIATESHGIYIYNHYLLPTEHPNTQQILMVIDVQKYLKNEKGTLIRGISLIRSQSSHVLFVCCEYTVLSLYLENEIELIFKDSVEKFETFCVIPNTSIIAVSTKGGTIFLYDAKTGEKNHMIGSGPCALVSPFKDYIVSVSGTASAFETAPASLVTVQSRHMNFVAYSQYIQHVTAVTEALSTCFVAVQGHSGTCVLLFELHSKDIHDRLQILIRKRLFSHAIKMAKLESRPTGEIEEIHRIHADWLYERGKYKEAVEAYCSAGSSVEPAHVIERFLLLNTKIYLYTYLLHLHKYNIDAPIHTTLLIKCLQSIYMCTASTDYKYAMAIDKEYGLLHKFLETFGTSHRERIREALKECRASRGFEFAKHVALALKDEEEYISILIEDFSDYEKAMEALKGANDEVCCNIILRHGRQLMKYDESALEALISRINTSMSEYNMNVYDVFLPVFTMDTAFLSKMVGFDGKGLSLYTFATRLQILLEGLQQADSSEVKSARSYEGATDGRFPEKSARSHTLSHADSTVYGHGEGMMSMETIVNTTRTEQDTSRSDQPEASNALPVDIIQDKIWRLLNSSTQTLEYQVIAMLLCLLYGFKQGANAMAVKMGYYHIPLAISNGMSDEEFKPLEYALRYGYNEPTLWAGTLSVIAGMAEKTPNLILEALQHIQNYKLLPFPTVVNILKQHKHITFRHVKDYLRREFKRLHDAISEIEKDIMQDQLECEALNRELQSFKQSYIILNNTNCSNCGLHLEFPSLHFYCKHSFHIYCVGIDNKCPKCYPIIQEIEESNESSSSSKQDSFFKFLSGSSDPFEYISQQFSKFSLKK